MKPTPDPGMCVSDGVISHHRAGWALFPFVGQCAHWWSEDKAIPPAIDQRGVRRAYASLCGLRADTTPQAPALAEGSWPRCRNCQRQVAKAKRR